jgi:hypothetical protein
MRKAFTTILFLFTICVHSQTVYEINAVLGIPDSLVNNEIRIYKKYFITNGTDIFRMYKGKDDKFIIEFYDYGHSIEGQIDKPYFERKEFTAPNNELFWMKICTSNIQYLPDWGDFQYKLKTPKIIFEDGQYQYGTTIISISDGVGYDVYFKDKGHANNIIYANPEAYLERFPGTDELEMFVSLLNTIKQELGIWED